MVLDINNKGAALVGGSRSSSGSSMKVVITFKGVYIQTGNGSILAKQGDVVEAPENEAKILIGLKRARLYDPVEDAPPPAVVEPEPEPVVVEPEPEPEPVVVKPAPRTGRGSRKAEED